MPGDAAGRIAARALAAGLCWLAAAGAAQAMETCAGTYSGSLINPLPTPNVMSFAPEDASGAPTALGNRFIAGLQRGGALLSGQPTTQLTVSASVLPPPSGSATQQPTRYHGFGWAADTSDSAASVISGTLQLTLNVTNVQSAEIDWIASLTCTILTNDKAKLVESIGELLGRAIGQNFDIRKF